MSPILFEIPTPLGPITIYNYGLLVLVGFLASFFVVSRLARRYSIPAGTIFDAGFVAIISGFVGAKISFLLSHPTFTKTFLKNPDWDIIFGGFDFLGGLLFAIPIVYFWLRKKGYHPFAFGDVMAPGFALAHAFGRLGCFMNGCCYGAPTDSFFGVTFPRGSIAFEDQLFENAIPAGAVESLPVFPTQLFESGLLLLLCIFLLFVVPRRKFAGQAIALYFAIYGLMRFGTQFTRADESLKVGPLDIWHVIALGVFAIGVGMFFYFRHRGDPPEKVLRDGFTPP